MRAPALSRAAFAGCALAASVAAAKPAGQTTPADRVAYATVNGLRMYYEEHGSGPPLVLLHGGGSTAQTSFAAIIPRWRGRTTSSLPNSRRTGTPGTGIDRCPSNRWPTTRRRSWASSA